MSRARRSSAPSATEAHTAWLELVDTDGPFLAVPTLRRVWPAGIPTPDPDAIATLREARPAFEKAWEHWDRHRDDEAALAFYREARDTWVAIVLGDVLGWPAPLGRDTGATVRSPDHAVRVRSNGVLAHGDTVGALVLVIDPVESLRDPLDDGWAAGPIDRMEMLLRASGDALGVVTDGRWWGLVSARGKTVVASGVVDALTWTEEPATRNAFLELLRPERLLAVEPGDRLSALFGESVAAAEDITEALGVQVRRAVELLVLALSEAARDAVARGEPDPLPPRRAEVYEAAVTIMMRTVFLLFAEERGLLPQSRLFTMGYGISGELAALDHRVREEGAEVLDATSLTWHRLLATSRALFHGASFEDLRLPAYGGSLFAPHRFGFLSARDERGVLTVTVSDRVMLEVLRAVQIAQLKGQPARPISFRDVDVEQIGYIYEGLLGYSSAPVDEVVVGLLGTPGEEPEIPLSQLDAIWRRHRGDEARAREILAWVAADQPAAKPPTKAALTKAVRAALEVEDAERALRAVTSDAALRERLKPYVGIIRRDLRERPLVVEPGGVVVIETPSRATAGAHYTPRSLAEEVVEHALAPLVYFPGPHQQPDGWELRSSDDILDLKVADIACGSGAFLVAAARYLAARLVEAWREERNVIGTPAEQQVRAIRAVVASCLYGADINAMAVEMCKLSLWLVSLDPKLPFSFVDDKILHGNSLLGVTDVEQLRALHIDPSAASNQIDMLSVPVDRVLDRASRLRRSLASEVDDADPQRSATNKRRQWADYQQLTASLSDIADGVIAAGLRLGGKPGRKLNEAYANLRIAVAQAYPADGSEPDRTMLDGIKEDGLMPAVPTDYDRWKPLHWVIAAPDVILDRGGFEAVIGNPPFLGVKKMSGAIGTNLREWQANVLADGLGGRSDLVAYFLLRAGELAVRLGSLGLVVTNTIAQGDTRQVGLDRIAESGFTITRCIQSRQWPSANANLEYAAIWGCMGEVAAEAPLFADDQLVDAISTLLEPAGRVGSNPYRLKSNGIAFSGCIPLGSGFVVSPDEAHVWFATDSRNREVVFPYLTGEDLYTQPDTTPIRYVIDFYDLSEAEARKYPIPYNRLKERALPERSRMNRKAVRERWWQFAEKRPGLRRATKNLEEVLLITVISRTLMPARVPNTAIFSNSLNVFATDSYSDQAILSSNVHQVWAMKYASGMRTDPRYTPSDVFETFPRPAPCDSLASMGETLDVQRREIMLRRRLGLTKLYNLVNDPDITDADIDVKRIREIHVELDHAVMLAYGWEDVPLDHGFHIYRQMQRWTVSPAARVEILDRLLEANHRRAALQGEAPPVEESDVDEEGDA